MKLTDTKGFEALYLLSDHDLHVENGVAQIIRSVALRWEIQKAARGNFYRPYLSFPPTEIDLLKWLRLNDFDAFLNTLKAQWPSISGSREIFPPRSTDSLRKIYHTDYCYDPVLTTLIAGLESRAYDRHRNGTWETINLGFNEARNTFQYYARRVRGYFRRGGPPSTHFFIILNSSYSTWERGSWINKLIATLDAIYDKPHLFVFPGFLTHQFLEANPLVPSLTGQEPARDLYLRLCHFVKALKQTGQVPSRVQTGLIGISGGANLAIHFLAQDHLVPLNERLLTNGAVAFSPILDARTTFQVLDESSAKILAAGFSPRKALTSFDMFVTAFFKGYTPNNLSAFLNLLVNASDREKQRTDFIYRFYREFQVVDLQAVIDAIYQQPSDYPYRRKKETITHSEYYLESVFPRHIRLFDLPSNLAFDDYTRMETHLALITDLPLLVIFALDDPVLSVSSFATQLHPPTRILQVLEYLSRHKNIRTFTPKRGAHMGYFLDTNFLLNILKDFFKREE